MFKKFKGIIRELVVLYLVLINREEMIVNMKVIGVMGGSDHDNSKEGEV